MDKDRARYIAECHAYFTPLLASQKGLRLKSSPRRKATKRTSGSRERSTSESNQSAQTTEELKKTSGDDCP